MTIPHNHTNLYLIVSVLACTAFSVVWQYLGWNLSSPDDQHARSAYILGSYFIAACLLVLSVLLFTILKRRTLVLVFAGVLLSMNANITSSHAKFRISITRKILEKSYEQLAVQIGQLPEKPEGPAFSQWNNPELLDHGYWRTKDGSGFEVYYHCASDSFVMRYPDGKWQWVGNGYAGG